MIIQSETVVLNLKKLFECGNFWTLHILAIKFYLGIPLNCSINKERFHKSEKVEKHWSMWEETVWQKRYRRWKEPTWIFIIAKPIKHDHNKTNPLFWFQESTRCFDCRCCCCCCYKGVNGNSLTLTRRR